MSYHKVNYQANGVDFADYFPAYEVGTVTITNIAQNSQFQISLTQNKYSTTNYVSFIQAHLSSGTADVYLLSRINQFTIYNKTASSYYVWMNCDPSIVSLAGVNLVLWCVTFYIQQTERSLVTSIPNLNYNVSGSIYNPCNYFPQFTVYQNAATTTTNNQTFTNSLSTKSSSLTTYLNFGSVTNNSVSATNADNVQKIMYLEVPKSSSQYVPRVYTNNASINTNVFLNTITMYVPTIAANNFVSNYKVESNALEDVFPICEIFTMAMTGSSGNRTTTFTLTKNTNSTTNYVVITSYSYYTNGSGGTYNPYDASIGGGMPIISLKTATNFKVTTTTGSGNNWNGGLNCLVIYI